jgi:hypothetical protein
MASGIMVGVLKEQHANHIVLGDNIHIPLPDGLAVERFTSGTPVTITYGYDRGGQMIVEGIKRTVTPKLPDVAPTTPGA